MRHINGSRTTRSDESDPRAAFSGTYLSEKPALSGAGPDRKPPEPEAVDEAARVITKKFFRGVLRPAGLLRKPRARAAKSLATLLLANVPASRGACPKAGTALERSALFNPDILIRPLALRVLHSACLMQVEFHQLDRHWGHLRVRHPARRRRSCWPRWPKSGQQTPIVVVATEGQPDRYVVIDG